MSIKKKYLKKKPVCKVTFRLPKEACVAAKTVHVVGDFNNWDTLATPMKRLKNGDFTATVDLDLYKEYQFRYLKDEKEWDNDRDADKHVPTPFGDCSNSVIIV
ncbi:MAG: glycoside hydrolase [Deltaproteobacteria bacterium]|nr:MAG: glycoside hydrolase [Deltaproteobacteria bacterium]